MTTSPAAEESTTTGSEVAQETVKYPKRPVALMLGFCGTGYSGMQINKNVKTVEGDLFRALCETGAVSEANSDDLYKVKFGRAARTDKGVHAAGQVVSLKMLLVPDIVRRLNEQLPPQIRVYGYARTNNGFSGSTQLFVPVVRVPATHVSVVCVHGDGARVVSYRPDDDPGFNDRVRACFQADDRQGGDVAVVEKEATTTDVDPNGDAAEEKAPTSKSHGKRKLSENASDEDSESDVSESEESPGAHDKLTAEQLKEMRSRRITPELLERTRAMLKEYEGSHNFHNYTVRKPHWETNARRTIVSFTCSDPFVVDDIEWVSLKIHGHSFMLHQIRKMVGVLILMMKTQTPLDLIPKTYGRVRIVTPKAPSLGLLLCHPLFNIHNRQIHKFGPQSAAEPIDFTMYDAEMEAFKTAWIYPEIFRVEKEKAVFVDWFMHLKHFGAHYAYLQSDGCIPQVYYDLAQSGLNAPEKRIAALTGKHSGGKKKHAKVNKYARPRRD